MRRQMLLIMAVTICMFVPSLALADTNDDELAKRYYVLGEELYNRADYDGALKQFKSAYDISKKPGLLFNIGRCYESLGQAEDAIKVYNEYLKHKPKNESIIKIRIENLQRQVAKKKGGTGPSAAAPLPVEPSSPQPAGPSPMTAAPVTSAAPSASAAAATPSGAGTTEPQKIEAEPAATTAESPQTIRNKKIISWSLIGAGSAMVVTGVILGVLVNSRASELEDANANHEQYYRYKDYEDGARTMQVLEFVSLGVGVAAAAAGGFLLYKTAKTPTETPATNNVWLQPSFGPSGVFINSGLRF